MIADPTDLAKPVDWNRGNDRNSNKRLSASRGIILTSTATLGPDPRFRSFLHNTTERTGRRIAEKQRI